MADKYGTDCGVKGMKNYLHILIKGAFVLFLIAYLTVLYTCLLYTSDAADEL